MFDANLRKAYANYLQCYRNHTSGVEKDVERIKNECKEQLEKQYAEKLTSLRKQAAEAASLVSKPGPLSNSLLRSVDKKHVFFAAFSLPPFFVTLEVWHTRSKNHEVVNVTVRKSTFFSPYMKKALGGHFSNELSGYGGWVLLWGSELT